MQVWAIRQKSTGYYLPILKGRAGGSWLEPTPDCLPRLFTSERNAKLALRAWLEGHWKTVSTMSSYENFDYDDIELTIVPVQGRSAEDMEVVPLNLVEV